MTSKNPSVSYSTHPSRSYSQSLFRAQQTACTALDVQDLPMRCTTSPQMPKQEQMRFCNKRMGKLCTDVIHLEFVAQAVCHPEIQQSNLKRFFKFISAFTTRQTCQHAYFLIISEAKHLLKFERNPSGEFNFAHLCQVSRLFWSKKIYKQSSLRFSCKAQLQSLWVSLNHSDESSKTSFKGHLSSGCHLAPILVCLKSHSEYFTSLLIE